MAKPQSDPLAPFRRLFKLGRYHDAALYAVEELELGQSDRVRFHKLLKDLKDGEDGPGWLLARRRQIEELVNAERKRMLALQKLVADDLARRRAEVAKRDDAVQRVHGNGAIAAFVDRDFSAPEGYLSWLRMHTPGPYHDSRGRKAQNVVDGCAKWAIGEILKADVGATRASARAIVRGLGFRPSGR